MKPSEIHDMTDDELAATLSELERTVFNLRIQKATGQLDNTAALKTTKRDLARVKTTMREKGLEGRAAKKTTATYLPVRTRRQGGYETGVLT